MSRNNRREKWSIGWFGPGDRRRKLGKFGENSKFHGFPAPVAGLSARQVLLRPTLYIWALLPKARSPASPSPGTIYPLAVSSSSISPHHIMALGSARNMYSIPTVHARAHTM